jgi:hypothetical protein
MKSFPHESDLSISICLRILLAASVFPRLDPNHLYLVHPTRSGSHLDDPCSELECRMGRVAELESKSITFYCCVRRCLGTGGPVLLLWPVFEYGQQVRCFRTILSL